MSSTSTSATTQSISKAKRAFLLNLALCGLLGIILIVRLLSDEPEMKTAQPENTSLLAPEPESALELANNAGQAHGLSENPNSYFPLIRRRLIQAAETAIDTIAHNLPTGDRYDREALFAAYIDGYQTRFKDYYSEQDGYDAGVLYGLKFDPMIDPQFSTLGMINSLNKNKGIATEKYSIDDVQWLVFQQGFIKGYASAYIQTKEGVTAKRGERIDLLEP